MAKNFWIYNISAWNPADPLPPGTEHADRNRFSAYKPRLIDPFFTPEGGNTSSACSAPISGAPSENSNNLHYNYTISKLSDFANASDLANELEPTFHNLVHKDIGGGPVGHRGDMGNFALAPKDLVFWRWHKYIDQIIYDKYVELKEPN